MGLFRLDKYNPKHSSAGRAWGFSRIASAQDGKDSIYMTRAWIGRLRFHLFHRGDQDPDCHDHPWGFWTFPLRSYVEEVLHPRVRTTRKPFSKTVDEVEYFERELVVVRAFRWHYRPASYRHRVLGAYIGSKLFATDPETFAAAPAHLHYEGLVPTIVWREKATRKWGFTKERDGIWCWVPWKTYVYEGGKHGPCE